ncbi:MAG: hypothetical protein KHW93_05830, partial [Butyricicoccus pullicaecorum]|nr:hypothetical protein [Butyricicoccus pullicaecorum]
SIAICLFLCPIMIHPSQRDYTTFRAKNFVNRPFIGPYRPAKQPIPLFRRFSSRRKISRKNFQDNFREILGKSNLLLK